MSKVRVLVGTHEDICIDRWAGNGKPRAILRGWEVYPQGLPLANRLCVSIRMVQTSDPALSRWSVAGRR
jgi:hypothetical protein